jgi:DNA-binding beta-propeller fold protein YncE
LSTPRPITALLSFPDMGSRRGLIALGTGLVASLLLLVGLASSASADDRVYWVNGTAVDANPISHADLDGSGGDDLDTTGAPSAEPRGVTLDMAAGKVYWTNRANNRISFANLDGTGGARDLETTGSLLPDHPNGAAVNPAEGRIYWANEWAGTIAWADLDTAVDGDALPTVGGTLTDPPVDTPITPMVDPGSRTIYWGNAAANVISYASLDGGDILTLNTAGATVNNPHGLALDSEAGRVYWANIGPVDNRIHVISYADLDGSGGGDLELAPNTANVPIGVAIDPSSGRIYWGNAGDDTLRWADLATAVGGDDQTTVQGMVTTLGATPEGPRSPVLLKAPSSTGEPEITPDGSELTCSKGSWVPDMQESWLYRAPSEFEYSWTRDNVVIPEADDATYRATVAGEYRCTVTGSNPAGDDTSPPSAAISLTNSPPTIDQPANRSDREGQQIDLTLDGSDPEGGDLSWSARGLPAGLAIDEATGRIHGTIAPGQARQQPYRVTVVATDHGTPALSDEASFDWTVTTPSQPPAGPAAGNPPPAGGPSQPSAPPAGPPSGGGSSKPPTTVAKPAFGAKTLVNMSVTARRIRGGSPIKVVVRNANGFQVSGRLSARASKRASGSRAFLVGSKGKATVTLRLSKSLRQLLKRKGKLSLRLTATVKDPAGGTRTVSKTVSLRLKTARR